MKKLNRFISLALTLGLALSVMATSVSASKFVDAHGNEVELDDTLEAYSSVVLSGADNAARKAETNLGDLWTDALRPITLLPSGTVAICAPTLLSASSARRSWQPSCPIPTRWL